MIPKFRAWDVHEKKMFTNAQLIVWNGNVYANDNSELNVDNLKGWSIDEKYLMQSTGLYIMSPFAEPCYERKEIFEGDILKWYYSEGVELQQQGIFVVVFENGAFRPGKDSDITLYEMLEDCDYIEVIGNIYENAELVKEATDE